jgi:hypothetical protein
VVWRYCAPRRKRPVRYPQDDDSSPAADATKDLGVIMLVTAGNGANVVD